MTNLSQAIKTVAQFNRTPLIWAVLWLSAGSVSAITLESPDGRLVATIETNAQNQLVYAVQWDHKTVIEPSRMGLTVDEQDYGASATLGEPEPYRIDETYSTYGVHALARNHCQGVRIPITNQDAAQTWTLECRAYNDGFAFRYQLPGTGERHISAEATTFTLPADSTCWFFERTNDWKLKTYAGAWMSAPVEQLPGISPTGPIQGPPLVTQLPDHAGYLVITEADLFNYSGMRLEAIGNRALQANYTESDGFALSGNIQTQSLQTPWRAIMLADGLDGLVNSDLVTNLCPAPDAHLFANTDYIQPGRSVWRWWAHETGTPAEEKQYIDAAQQLGFEYTTIDEGWKDWPQPFADLADVCRYATERHVGVFVWSHWKDVNDPADDYAQLNTFLKQVAQSGARGVKIDFMNGESLECVRFNEAVLRHAAEHRLMVNFHGCGKPTGESRTYPNEITREAIRGLELNRMNRPLPASHDAALPFTRFVVGHGDYTPLTVEPDRLGATTVAHQVATWLAFTSPFQVLAEDPQRLMKNERYASIVEFLKAAPASWDETRVLSGSKIGVLAVLARRTGDDWFVAGVNGETAGEVDLNLDFLEAPTWNATLITDGGKATDIRTVTQTVQRGETLKLNMAAGGGFAVRLTPAPQQSTAWQFEQHKNGYTLTTADYVLNITTTTAVAHKFAFRMALTPSDGGPTIEQHALCGLEILGAPVLRVKKVERTPETVRLTVYMTSGEYATVVLRPAPHALTIETEAPWAGQSAIQFAGLAPAYGLGDHGGQHTAANLAGNEFRGLTQDGGSKQCRFFAPFVIFPKQRFAAVNFDTGPVSVALRNDIFRMETHRATKSRYTLFVGDLDEIYAAYRLARDAVGYPGVAPKYRFFELGWESWDALRWKTNQQTVTDILQRFMDHDYPIRWAVTGSGFWADGGSTTSFGQWNTEKYPDVNGFRDWLHAHDIAWLIGLRTHFDIEKGPFTADGVQRDVFAYNPDGTRVVRDPGRHIGNPDCYMLDSTRPGAAEWYADLYELWGVDGVKEDTMVKMPQAGTYNGAMVELAKRGALVMARNGAFTSPGTLQRMEDMVTLDVMTDRMPITWLQCAASAAPNAYCDTVGWGGSMQDNPIGALRHAWFTALTAGMAIGAEPWHWSEEQQRILRKAIDFHLDLSPYLYSAAVDSFATGFPRTMTPLPIAYPDDSRTYDLARYDTQQYEWMVGASLLAAPLLRKDYRTNDRMDIYLPRGEWIAFESGERYIGPQTLKDYEMPLAQTPCFVGGPGILLMRGAEAGTVEAVVYALPPQRETVVFTHPNGKTTSRITKENTGWNAATLKVRDDATGVNVPLHRDAKTGAVRFVVQPQHNYRIIGGGNP